MPDDPHESAARAPWRVRVYNQIAPAGLQRLPAARYLAGPRLDEPDALLLRSADLHHEPIPPSVKVVARAGTGTNNIPVSALSARGVPVFNTPGANAQAVQELVVAGLLMAARQVVPALRFVQSLNPSAPDFADQVEAGKSSFVGHELAGQTLGVIGLGRVGALVADAAIHLGMQVRGHDPEITVDAAWSLPSQVRRASSVDEVMRTCHFVSLHVPLTDATRHLVDARRLALAPPGAVLLNFAREGVVDDAAVLRALDGEQLAAYVSDFPAPALLGHPRAVLLPHLGASTHEAEEKCAVMAADELRAFLEDGHISHSVNFPALSLSRGTPYRLAIANANVPHVLGRISSTLAAAGLNIGDLANQSRGELAYTLVDVDTPVSPEVIAQLAAQEGILSVRYLPTA
ncbi:MAG: hypothetical protein RIS88_526 [Pseudomonadota bacterium]